MGDPAPYKAKASEFTPSSVVSSDNSGTQKKFYTPRPGQSQDQADAEGWLLDKYEKNPTVDPSDPSLYVNAEKQLGRPLTEDEKRAVVEMNQRLRDKFLTSKGRAPPPKETDEQLKAKALANAPDATDAILRSQKTALTGSRRGSFLTGPGGMPSGGGSGPQLGTDETGANRKKMGGMSEDALTNILRQRGW